MALYSYTIKSFIGGIADEAKIGVPGAFRNGFNLDIHQHGKNVLRCNQGLKSIGSGVVVDKIIKLVPISATKSYGFGDAGNVYKIENETITKVYTDSNGKILDADYFYGYLYWTTATKLGRCLETSNNWSGDANKDYKTLENCSNHPLFIVPKSDMMCIGNDRYVAILDADNHFNPEALDLFYGWTIKCFGLKKPSLLIGAVNHKKAELFEWSLVPIDSSGTLPDSYDPIDGWEERDIYGMLAGVGGQYLFTPAMIYWFREGLVDYIKEIQSEVSQGAIDIWKSKILFGGKNGVYSIYRRNRNYPLALNLEYTPSPITISNFNNKNIEIGAILGRGDNVLVSWKDDKSYGLDILDNSNKAEAVYEGLMFDAQRPEDKLFRYIKLVTKPLPANCSIKIKYRMNENDDWTEASMEQATDNSDKETFDKENGTKAIYTIGGQGENYEIRVELYPHGNDTPEILEINNYFQLLTLF